MTKVCAEMEAWLRSQDKTSRTHPHQLGAIGWFMVQGWKPKWPLMHAAMVGDCQAIENLMNQGVDPNQKMTDWFDSQAVGWAASFGRVDSLITLILWGADPFQINNAGNDAMKDAQREKYQNVFNFLRNYKIKRDELKQKNSPKPAEPKPQLSEKEIIERYLKKEEEKKKQEELQRKREEEVIAKYKESMEAEAKKKAEEEAKANANKQLSEEEIIARYVKRQEEEKAAQQMLQQREDEMKARREQEDQERKKKEAMTQQQILAAATEHYNGQDEVTGM